MFKGKEYNPVGFVSYVAARKIYDNTVELSWYANIHTRFHELCITLPKSEFVTCVGSWRYDEKPHIFVKGPWLEELHLRLYSVFCLIDAIGVREALRNNLLTRERLVALRTAIDELAKHYPQVSFITFADSTLLKSNWSIGHFKSDVKYTYEPEIFIKIIKEFQAIYQNTLGLNIYAVLSQGSNEYYDDSLLHISETKNHICLNSLGTPFEQLKSIEDAARIAIRSRIHEPAELYMDEQFYHSLSFQHSFDKHALTNSNYRSKMMSADSIYFYSSCQTILDNLK